MNNEIQIFSNEEFGEIRTLAIDGEPWFVGKDVVEILGYTNPSKALADHVDDEDKLNNDSLSSLGQRGRLLPYQKRNNGYLEIKEAFNNASDWNGVQTLVTPKGREHFRTLYPCA